MPSRNIVKIDVDQSYYHVYARGASRKDIFLDEEDYRVFLNLCKRYLSREPMTDRLGREYKNFYDNVELLAFCLMPNHFHLLFYQDEAGAISHLMRGVMTSYSGYFNRKYSRSGALFESRYKSSRISDDAYLMHISRYIHLNPKQWRTWSWSSLANYLGRAESDWLRPERITELFASREMYEKFVADYEDSQRMIEAIKHELANS